MSLVLYGEMGTGKSTFPEILSFIIGNDVNKYFTKFDNIEDMKSRFNSEMMTSIITAVEEIPTNANNYHSFWTKLNSLITEKYMSFEKKVVDRFKGESLNNFILITNYTSSIHVPQGNRRHIITKVSNKYKTNREFYSRMRKEINDNIKLIRYFFDMFDYIDDLNSIRPTTQIELEMRQLNKNSFELFMDELEDIDEYDKDIFTVIIRGIEYIRLDELYKVYRDFCSDSGNKPFKIETFSSKLQENGFEKVGRKTYNQQKITVFQKISTEMTISALKSFENLHIK
jgi:phage/plasmid-associated DNA primase